MSACNCMGCPHRANCRCRCEECKQEWNRDQKRWYEDYLMGLYPPIMPPIKDETPQDEGFA